MHDMGQSNDSEIFDFFIFSRNFRLYISYRSFSEGRIFSRKLSHRSWLSNSRFATKNLALKCWTNNSKVSPSTSLASLAKSFARSLAESLA